MQRFHCVYLLRKISSNSCYTLENNSFQVIDIVCPIIYNTNTMKNVLSCSSDTFEKRQAEIPCFINITLIITRKVIFDFNLMFHKTLCKTKNF